MKSYGRLDSSWDKAKFRSILEDGLDLAKKHDITLCLCEDKYGDISLLPSRKATSIHIFACGITPYEISDYWPDAPNKKEVEEMLKDEFWDSDEHASYTIDEIVPRVYDCLVNGIIEYGQIRYMSEGTKQLVRVLTDAEKLVEKYNKPFIAGLNKKLCISVCPMSEKSQFYDPLSCVITKSGFWSGSNMHSNRISRFAYRMASSKPDWSESIDYDAVVDLLYKGITYRRKSYGALEDDQDHCILKLESILEDAVRMPKDIQYVIVVSSGSITLMPREYKPDRGFSFEVDPKDFWDEKGDVLLTEKISIAARDMYEAFYQTKNSA